MIISFANIKGGSGKTTSSALLISGLIERGYRVAALDCDPLWTLHEWCSTAGPSRLSSARAEKAADISRHLDQFKRQADFIVVDLSAATDVMNALTFALSDFVVVPMQGSAVDARGAIHTLNLLKLVEENRRMVIKSSVLLTRLNPIVLTHSAKHVNQVIAEQKIPFLDAAILERSAYRDMFMKMESLFGAEDPRIHNLEKARRDILYLTDAVQKRLAS
ncbi:ParA family protein [Xaviernesmea oryzae]|nr:ParA family protein [Xaviernesmea oryzae]SEL84633.1 chromosome partitioning protein [Xaviernesmea oryzae]